MRYAIPIFMLTLLACAMLTLGCASAPGPGSECDTCAVAEANPSASHGSTANAAAATATGGQRASNQPTMTDTAAIRPFTTVGRGAGPTTATMTAQDERSQAGAPSVNQGLVIPNSAEAQAGGGASSPLMLELQAHAKDLRAQLALLLVDPMPGNEVKRDLVMEELRGTYRMMAEVSASTRGVTHNVYNFQGSRNVQSVANGSSSGDGMPPVSADVAREVGKPLAEGVASVMESKPEPTPNLNLPPVAPVEGDSPRSTGLGEPPAGGDR